MRRRRRSKIKKEEIAEDYCFVCKDGGLLMVCDYKDCLKAYHPQCVGKEDSFLESDESWSCSWHSCFNCQKASKFQCYVCPKAVCGSCLSVSEFAQVRGKKGFCSHCLKLALLIEDEMDVDSDGGKVDFKDRETYEFLFMEYYEIIKDKEGITAENVHSADALLKKGKNYGSSSDSDELYKGHEEDQLELSDCDDMDDSEGHKRVVRRKSSVKGKATPLKREFIGWGSKVLIEFLASIGQDTTQKLSQYDVTSIISRYVNDNNLLHPQKKRKVLCDERLRPVLGRKSVNKNKIYDIVEGHLAENLEESEDDEARYSSEDKDETVLMACKRQRKSNLETPQIKELTPLIPQSRFAAIVPKNIKLIYLKRSLMLELLKQPDTFESKVKGSFVKVKADSYWYSQNQTHQLFQVTGIKKTSETQEINAEILLQVPNAKDIRINMLAELDLTEGECEDYRQKVKEGLYKRLTIVELEEKARSLHEDITKHWIEKEISLLQNLIDRANEKGWRRELFEYLDRKQLLMSSTEQSRLLNEVPKAIPDIEELEPASGDSSADDKQVDNGSPRTILIETTKTPSDKLKGKGYGDISNKSSASGIIGSGSGSDEDGNKEATDGNASQKDNEGDGNNKEHSADEIVGSDSASDINGKGKTTIGNTDTKVDEEKQQLSEASEAAGSEELFQQCQQSQIITPVGRSDLILQKMSRQMTSCFAGEKQMAPVAEFIELSDDDDDDDEDDNDGRKTPEAAKQKQTQSAPECEAWHCVGPLGERKGPFSLPLLKRWSDSSPYASKYKVWKTGQCEDKAILLGDAIRQLFPENPKKN
ncbi:hypothetical protein VitviT2T_018832 [Vitis vinifera]|uniref:Zinc finger CCCH domain-containing protein 44 n=1 Tax=Vitis vinifera TaxID=29760 RepID=A0ABY9CYX0_VITVI|nr:hypothetical protein VitviT2T_018832 [Vitis vinifera]